MSVFSLSFPFISKDHVWKIDGAGKACISARH